MKNKRLIIMLSIIAVLLFIPYVAMQFTNEVNWGLFDFVIMGVLLLIAGISGEIVLRKVQKLKYRIAICLSIIVAFLLIWAELAVGIFGTPLAGS